MSQPTFYFREEGGEISVVLRTESAANAWQGMVLVPRDSVLSISSRGITDIWQTAPALDGQGIVFAGGKTGGFSGEGELFRFVLRRPSDLSFASDTRLYLHDGVGTEAAADLLPLAQASAGQAVADTRPPEPFLVEIFQNPEMFQGEAVAIFQAEDRDTGVARYEVREHTKDGPGVWHEAKSPYLLHEDVNLLEVRAIDNAGNMRMETTSTGELMPLWAWIILIVILMTAFFALVMRYTKSKL